MGFQATRLPSPNRTGQPASKGPAWRSSGVYLRAAEAAVRSRWGRGDVHALAADLKTRKGLGQGVSARGREDHRQADTDAMLAEAGRCILALAADPANSTPGCCVGVR
jgi:hypothetical protein